MLAILIYFRLVICICIRLFDFTLLPFSFNHYLSVCFVLLVGDWNTNNVAMKMRLMFISFSYFETLQDNYEYGFWLIWRKNYHWTKYGIWQIKCHWNDSIGTNFYVFLSTYIFSVLIYTRLSCVEHRLFWLRFLLLQTWIDDKILYRNRIINMLW